jgi:tetratricopeptide (TPR) repeat protein
MVRAFWLTAAFIFLIVPPALAESDFDVCVSNSNEVQAVKACDRVIAGGSLHKNDDLVRVYYERGIKLKYGRRFDEAIRDFTKSIQLDHKFTRSYVARGHSYAYKKQFPLAFADQETAVRLEANEITYTGRAMDLMESGAYDRAIADLNEALRINDKYFYGYLRRGEAYLKKREFAKAESDYRKALEIKPADKNAQDGLTSAQNRKAD